MAHKQAFVIVIAVLALVYFFVLSPGKAPQEEGADNIFAEDSAEEPGLVELPEANLQPLEGVEPVPTPRRRSPRKAARPAKKYLPEPEPEFEEEPETDLLPVADPEPTPSTPPVPVASSPAKNTQPVSNEELAAELQGDTPPPAVHQQPAPRPPAPRSSAPRAPVPQLDLDGYAASASPNIDYEFELDAPAANKLPELERELNNSQ